MGVFLALENHRRVASMLATEPIIINYLPTITKEERDRADRLVSTHYESDLLSNEPACECGVMRGGWRIGLVHGGDDGCGTAVRHNLQQELEPRVWMRSPLGVSKLINPKVLKMLSDHFKKGGFDIIRYFLDTTYHPNIAVPDDVYKLKAMGLNRGYNHFVEDFRFYVDALFALRRGKGVKHTRPEPLHQLIEEQWDCVLSDEIPLPNKALLVVEDTQVGTFVDPMIAGALEAIRTIISIDTPQANWKVRQKENRTAKTLFALADFYREMDTHVLAGKNGIFRKHIFGSRNAFSMRAVISSITAPHDYETLLLPWAGALTMLECHLVSKLFHRINPDKARRYTPNEMLGYIQRSVYHFDQGLYDLFEELIQESPDQGLWCTFQRNPSLERASMQALKVTGVKKNPKDPTISWSIMDVKGPNADFDGDQMNLVLALDNKTARGLQHLRPHKSMLELNKWRQLSGNAAMPKPVVSTNAEWYTRPERPAPQPHKTAFMAALEECA